MRRETNPEQGNFCKELVQKAVAGDDASFIELANRHVEPLRLFLMRKGISLSDADDLVQETLIRAHKGLARYDGRHAFSTWLYSIATNLAVNLHRKTAREGKVRVEHASEILDTVHKGASECETVRPASDIWDRASTILSNSQLKVLWLRYGENMSTREIARTLGMSHVSVRVCLHRARALLARRLREDELKGV